MSDVSLQAHYLRLVFGFRCDLVVLGAFDLVRCFVAAALSFLAGFLLLLLRISRSFCLVGGMAKLRTGDASDVKEDEEEKSPSNDAAGYDSCREARKSDCCS